MLTDQQKSELVRLPFISSNVQNETDFFKLVISLFSLEGGNDVLLADIANKNRGKSVNDDFLQEIT